MQHQAPRSAYQRVRVVCISDTHNRTPYLPAGDILIHAGDLTNQGSYTELEKQVKWLQSKPFKARVVIAGNHDVTLDREFNKELGSRSRGQSDAQVEACIRLLREAEGITYLCHEATELTIEVSPGSGVRLNLFGSPYIPKLDDWAFGYSNTFEAKRIWNDIPQNMDILVTHVPPPPRDYIGQLKDDDAEDLRLMGLVRRMSCEVLQQSVVRIRPMLHVCGHFHLAREVTRTVWHPSSQTSLMQENQPLLHNTSTNPKQDIIDLTGRRGRPFGTLPPSYGSKAHEIIQGSNEGTVLQETCTVHAPILACRHGKSKSLNKAIVVDLNLPLIDIDSRTTIEKRTRTPLS